MFALRYSVLLIFPTCTYAVEFVSLVPIYGLFQSSFLSRLLPVPLAQSQSLVSVTQALIN